MCWVCRGFPLVFVQPCNPCLYLLCRETCDWVWETTETRTALEVKKLLIMFGNIWQMWIMTRGNGEELPEGGNWAWHLVRPHVRLADMSLMSTLCQQLFSLGFQQVPECPLRHCQSLQPISHSLNVCQAKLKIVPPCFILGHSQSQNYSWSICQRSSWQLRDILHRWRPYLPWYIICWLIFPLVFKYRACLWAKQPFMLSILWQATSNRRVFRQRF